MAHAIEYTEFGGPDVLQLSDIDVPAPGDGEVWVQIEFAGVNPVDYKLRSGMRASDPITTPRRVGADGSGVIRGLGSNVEGFAEGNRVLIFGATGTYATDIVISQHNLRKLPPEVGSDQAAAIGIPVGTAYQSLRSLNVGKGDVLLIHGGSGAVGQAAIQFATLWGAVVIATTSEKRRRRVHELGAIPVRYGDGLADRVRQAAPGPITAALDFAGTDEALDTSVELVADTSRIATIVRGADAPKWGIRAFAGGSSVGLTDIEQRWRSDALSVTLALLSVGRFSIEIGPEYRLADAAKAQQLVEEGAQGKVLLRA